MRLRSDENLWEREDKNGLEIYEPLKNNISIDIAVIGGGITGALISEALTDAGLEVALIEKNTIGSGSTLASTSFLQYETDMHLQKLSEKIGLNEAAEVYRECKGAVETIKNLISRYNIDCEFKNKNSLNFAHDNKMAGELKKEFELRKKFFNDIRFLTEEELLKDFHVKSKAGILSMNAGAMNPVAFTRQLIFNNYNKGLKVYTNTKIISIADYRLNYKILTTENGSRIICNFLVFCTGYETFNFIKKCSARLFSTWAVATKEHEEVPEVFKDVLFWNTASPYLYFTATGNGRLIAGGGDTLFRPVNFTENLKQRKSSLICRKFRYYVQGKELKPEISWGGVFGSSRDSLPIIGKVNGSKNVFAVVGLGGNGIVFSVLGMQMVLSMIRKKKHAFEKYFLPCR